MENQNIINNILNEWILRSHDGLMSGHNTPENMAVLNEILAGYKITIYKEPTKSENKIKITFDDGTKVEITGPVDKSYKIKFIDFHTGYVVYETKIKNNMWAATSTNHLNTQVIEVYDITDGYDVLVEKHTFDSKEPVPSITNIDCEITYLDIGSSGGLPPKWSTYVSSDFFHVILVEPNAQEAENLKRLYPKAIVIPFALGRTEGKSILNSTYHQGCSSILTPNEKVLDRFPVKKWFQIEKKIEVNLYPFDSLASKFGFKNPDFIKIDVQGFESEVLLGFGHYLDTVLCIELETHLFPIYKEQKTLEGITHLLESKGFFLRHLKPTGIFEDEVIEFDAFYIKKPHLVKTELEKKKIDFWSKVNRLPRGRYFKDFG